VGVACGCGGVRGRESSAQGLRVSQDGSVRTLAVGLGNGGRDGRCGRRNRVVAAGRWRAERVVRLPRDLGPGDWVGHRGAPARTAAASALDRHPGHRARRAGIRDARRPGGQTPPAPRLSGVTVSPCRCTPARWSARSNRRPRAGSYCRWHENDPLVDVLVDVAVLAIRRCWSPSQPPRWRQPQPDPGRDQRRHDHPLQFSDLLGVLLQEDPLLGR
jgi:hypothetical protein